MLPTCPTPASRMTSTLPTCFIPSLSSPCAHGRVGGRRHIRPGLRPLVHRDGEVCPKTIYKKFADYSPGVAAIGEVIVSVENREGNAMYVFTSGTPWDGWRNPTYGLAVFVRTVVYARRGLWTWWGSIAGFSISAPTGVPRFMTTSSPCGDGKPKRLKAQASS